MGQRVKQFKYLKGYELSGCAIRTKNIISFWGQKWSKDDDDPLVARPTRLCFYYRDEPAKDRWAYRGITTSGLHGCPIFRPKEQWVFVMDDGAVVVAGSGDDGFEKNIVQKKHAYFTNVKNIAHGYAYAVGVHRKVFRREKKDQWVRVGNTAPAGPGEPEAGFSDIDGFGEDEIYACGGHGDLWLFDGRQWEKINLPVDKRDPVLYRICCGGDGRVYILTNVHTILVGRKKSWKTLQSATSDVLENLVWYQDRIYVSTVDALYEIVNDKMVPTRLKLPRQTSYAHLASGDGMLLVTGSKQASLYDGEKWTRIIE